MDFIKDLTQWCTRLQGKPMVAFFCQYSAHRAPSVANLYRQSCTPKQRVLVMEGGFRAWEAQRLPVQPGNSSLSKEALDNLALKIGAEVVAATPSITQRWSQTSFASFQKSWLRAPDGSGFLSTPNYSPKTGFDFRSFRICHARTAKEWHSSSSPKIVVVVISTIFQQLCHTCSSKKYQKIQQKSNPYHPPRPWRPGAPPRARWTTSRASCRSCCPTEHGWDSTGVPWRLVKKNMGKTCKNYITHVIEKKYIYFEQLHDMQAKN